MSCLKHHLLFAEVDRAPYVPFQAGIEELLRRASRERFNGDDDLHVFFYRCPGLSPEERLSICYQRVEPQSTKVAKKVEGPERACNAPSSGMNHCRRAD